MGPRAGRDDPRLGQGTQIGDFSSSSRGKLCANLDGFSLHAAVRVDACSRDRLEKLCRYAARPPILHERLSLTDSGMLLYKFKKPWRDGSSHVVLTPLALMERLAALIPAPRVKLVIYHGVFASAFPLRHTVVPPPPQSQAQPGHPERSAFDLDSRARHTTSALCVPAPESDTQTKPKPKPRPRYSWAELLRRVVLIEVLTCPHCNGRRRLLAFITDPQSITRILAHLGLPTELPTLAPARAPPRSALPFA